MKHRRLFTQIVLGTVLFIVAVSYLFPMFWMVTTSLKSMGELYEYPPTILPAQPTLKAFTTVLIEKNYVQLIRNSLVINLLTITLTLALSLLIN